MGVVLDDQLLGLPKVPDGLFVALGVLNKALVFLQDRIPVLLVRYLDVLDPERDPFKSAEFVPQTFQSGDDLGVPVRVLLMHLGQDVFQDRSGHRFIHLDVWRQGFVDQILGEGLHLFPQAPFGENSVEESLERCQCSCFVGVVIEVVGGHGSM